MLAHASHRGDEMLEQMRIVLGTVSARFNPDLFLRFPLMALSPEAIEERLSETAAIEEMHMFLERFADFCAEA